jgi:6-phosphogluconolactonase
MSARYEVLPDAQALARRVAGWLVDLAEARNGRFAIALSGGSTPKILYEMLAAPPFLERFPWSRTHFFWGDERFVPADDPQSNFRMTREALLSRARIPSANIHAMPTTGSPEAAAAAYERELKAFYGAERLDPSRPLFDVALLGLGGDGHTASLFPGSPALGEREHWVASVDDAKRGPRLTLTWPALESARQTAFLVTGKDKREILDRFRDGDKSLPAANLKPHGALTVFCDEAAAG